LCIKNGDKFNVTSEELNEIILDIERAIIILMNKPLPDRSFSLTDNNEYHIIPHEYFLAKLIARDPQQGRARIFTTNYDTLIEQTMDRLGIVYSDGFTGTVNRKFNPAAYDLDFYYPGEITEGRVKRYDKVIQLYKLHGSINWRSSITQVGDPFGINFNCSALPTIEEVLENNGLFDGVIKRGKSVLGILPMSTKYGETLTMPYAHLFRLMFSALKETQTICFIIGYSGWDYHINRLIEDSLTNPTFNCVIVDPFLSNWARTLLDSDYCGRVYSFTGEWGKFENFATNILPDIEILKTDLNVQKTIRSLQKIRENLSSSNSNE